MEDNRFDEDGNLKKHTGFEYLGPQSEVAEKRLPELPANRLTHHPMPVEGELPVENYGNVDFQFTWPELEKIEDLNQPAVRPKSMEHFERTGELATDDEWAGKDYPATRSEG